tara:strand:- start:236 stop:733 length:498 start_codon:yes stop_codon:yes gene_type:complete
MFSLTELDHGPGVRLVDFHPSHWRAVEPFDEERVTLSSIPTARAQEIFDYNAVAGPAYTGFIDGEIAACFGFAEQFPGVAETWMICDRSVYRFGRLRRFWPPLDAGLTATAQYHGWFRVSATVLCRFPAAVRLLEKLYFRREGVCRKSSPTGEDMYLMARLFRWE